METNNMIQNDKRFVRSAVCVLLTRGYMAIGWGVKINIVWGGSTQSVGAWDKLQHFANVFI